MLGLYALGFWVPRILTSHAVPLRRLGWLSAVPWACGAVGMLVWGQSADRGRPRAVHVSAAFAVAGAGMLLTAFATNWLVAVAGLSTSAVGVLTAMPIFWADVSQRFSGGIAAVTIAIVNSVGNIGGFVSPYATGLLLKRTQGYRTGLLATALCLFCGAALVRAAFTRETKRAAGMIA